MLTYQNVRASDLDPTNILIASRASAHSITLPALLWAHTGGLRLLALTLVRVAGLGPGTQGVLGGLPVNPLGAGGGFLCGPMGAALREKSKKKSK